MTPHTIPCDTYVRLSKLSNAKRSDDPWAHSIRIDNGCAMATNRELMVVERIEPSNPEPLHIAIDLVLIAAAEKEIGFHSSLSIVSNPFLKFASAKTTLGYQHPNNAALYLGEPNELDRWREIVPLEPHEESKGSMQLETHHLQWLAQTSPSGNITFPRVIDWTKPVIVRDAIDDRWFGVFYVREADGPHKPAVLPGWFTV